MGINTEIAWTHATYNPWMGCHKVSPGCKVCYMFRDMETRFTQFDPNVVRKSTTKFNAPYEIERDPEKTLIFTCSWSDFFIEDADEWRPYVWQIINNTPRMQYQILTKRENNIVPRLPTDENGKRYLPKNVWMGVSAENNDMLHQRWERLALIKQNYPGLYWLSLEPLLEPVGQELKRMFTSMDVLPDWIVVGGESGDPSGDYKARPCEPVWILDIIEICREFDVPVFVKQTGSVFARKKKYYHSHGGKMHEWPHQIQVRQFPKIK